MGLEIRNAVIKSAFLGIEDHGILTAFIGLDYGGSGQSFGGYGLGSPSSLEKPDYKVSAAGGYCAHFIVRVLLTVGVDSWDKLVGKTIRVKAEHCKAHSIGNILLDDWFDPSVDFADDPK